MASSMIRLGFFRSLSGGFWKKTVDKKCQYVGIWNRCVIERDNICQQCRVLHMTTIRNKKRKTQEEKKSPKVINFGPKPKHKDKVVDIWKNMTVLDLAETIGKNVDHVFEVMMYVDDSVYYNKPSSVIDNFRVIQEVVKKSGMKFKVVPRPDEKEIEAVNKDITKRPPPDPSVLVKRPPVVTVMGHVDHGKTTLLDSLRNTSVVETEFGGITQHIGAFSVELQSGDTITFLDTPGHAAFTAMRARGAQVTDLVVLVVAADDGVMEQTVESIKMAKAAEVPIIVAINKIDKPEADIIDALYHLPPFQDRTKDMLVKHGIQVEDKGGDVQAIPISALKGTNLDTLSEAIVLQAEMMNLKGDPRGLVEGTVVESKTDPYRGKLSTSIVQRGTLRKGSILVAGLAWAKVRAMFNEKGQPIQEAPPSTPAEILGWRELPSAGEEILEVESEVQKLDILPLLCFIRLREAFFICIRKVHYISYAILDVLETYDGNDICKLDLVHYGVGAVTETDLELADAFKGEANVLQVFEVSEGKKKLPVAGSRCTKGILRKAGKYRLVRGNDTIYDGSLASMRHLKNEVDSIKKDVECGLRLDDGTISVQPGDTIICYEIRNEEQKTDWDPGF
ncbi:Translation initiation factor IF-2 [Blattella germanica]|nr:Translation initiation factor IF-2 [Blattella germanica]